MSDFYNICRTDGRYFIESRRISTLEGVPPGWLVMDPPTGPGPYFVLDLSGWLSTDVPPIAAVSATKALMPVSFWMLRLTNDEMKAFKKLDLQQKALTVEDYDDPLKEGIVQWSVFMEHFNRLTTEIDLNHITTRQGLNLFGWLAGIDSVRIEELLSPPEIT